MPHPSYHQPLGKPFIELDSVDSTNNYALAKIRAGLAHNGMAIFAHEQVAGKGQRGKTWLSSKNENIALSIILKPVPLALSAQFQLGVAVALAARNFFGKYAGMEAKIKWPNDLYWKDRKAGGILIESGVKSREVRKSGSPKDGSQESGRREVEGGSWEWAVIGIGININQANFPAGLDNPVSLKQITGKDFDTVYLAKELCSFVDRYYHMLLAEGFESILPEYLSHFYKKDEKVKLKKGSRVFEAIIKGISPKGKLVVQHGTEEQFDLGEVQWLIG